MAILILFLSVVLFFIVIICSIKFFALNYMSFNRVSYKASNIYEKAVLIVLSSKKRGGKEVCCINQYKTFLDQNYSIYFLAASNSTTKKDLIRERLNFYSCFMFKIAYRNFIFQPLLVRAIYKICKKHDIDIVHCNNVSNIDAIKKVQKKLHIKGVYTRHDFTPWNKMPSSTSCLCGIIGVSKKDTVYLNTHQEKNNTIKISTVTPFFDESLFLSFKPFRSRKEFFEQEFGIQLKDCPLLCKVAYFRESKNHPLLFNAIHNLIYGHETSIQVALAGDGGRMREYQEMVSDLKINDYVYFLGNVHLKAELLYHANIKILVSLKDQFPIVLLEAALMKKSLIVSDGVASAGALIVDNSTGLLFKNNNVDSLVDKIRLLLSDPDLGRKLGQNAYTLSIKEFGNKSNFDKLSRFYESV
jgi:glycosyltransferase involved in cell wall biosynthesis